jgi:hypothetical protein
MTSVLVKFCAINILHNSDGGIETELQTYGLKNGLVASEDRVFLVDNICNCEVSIYELPGPEQVVRSGLLQQEVIEELTLVSTMYTNVQVFPPNKQANSEHTLNCFYQSDRIFLMSHSGNEAVMYHLVDGTWIKIIE